MLASSSCRSLAYFTGTPTTCVIACMHTFTPRGEAMILLGSCRSRLCTGKLSALPFNSNRQWCCTQCASLSNLVHGLAQIRLHCACSEGYTELKGKGEVGPLCYHLTCSG